MTGMNACATLLHLAVLITGARVADGTGAPLREAAVRIEGSRIIDVGDLKPKPGETIIRGGQAELSEGQPVRVNSKSW